MTNVNPKLIFCILPAFLVGVMFEIFLGHRHDYTGHFAAGYGATLGVYMVWFRILPDETFRRRSTLSLLPICVLCILLGVIAELTVFRIAKFDEIDFFNQSLGAVLAGIAAAPFAENDKPDVMQFDYGVIIAIVFLSLGGCFAVA